MIRVQLSQVLQTVVSQQLLPAANGGQITRETALCVASKTLVDTYTVILKTRLTLNEVIEKARLDYSYMVSDCSAEKLSDLANTPEGFGAAEYRMLEGEAVEGEKYMEYYVDEAAVGELVTELFYEPADNT